ncbi:hypothetical protein [Fusibacter sp. 3D3]|uniref:hypothetical protein n=1 Tax=Fusibacter sp. 3D3 TaxID=1048380 RepID=UPI000852F9B0|nr:hypothetical protein [Fusibacter sp. 3D3]
MDKKLIILRVILVIGVILYPIFRYLNINSIFLAPFLYAPSVIFRPKKMKAFVLDLIVFPCIALFLFCHKTGNRDMGANILIAMVVAVCIWICFITYQRYRGIDPFK